MKLSKLAYLCVKNSNYSDDASFTYDAFIKGLFNNSPDHSLEINNMFQGINEAISRLSDLERIPYEVEPVTHNDNIISLNFEKPVKEVISVAQLYKGSYRRCQFRNFGIDKIFVNSFIYDGFPLYVEFKVDIPFFDDEDIAYTFDESGNLISAVDVDLKDYGITDSMCNYIIEYVSSKLSEPVAAELANMHFTRAEQYFSGISPVRSAFSQQSIEAVDKIGD